MLLLTFALLFNLILVVVTFGIRVPGGIFIPSMVAGASSGRIIGELLSRTFLVKFLPESCFNGSCVKPGVYALIGGIFWLIQASSFLSGVTKMTISLTVIIFELTGALNFVLPLMMSILISKWVSDAFDKQSIHDYVIRVNSYPYMSDGKPGLPVESMAKQIMTSTLTLETDVVYTIPEIARKIQELAHSYPARDGGLPIIDAEGIVFYICR